MIHLRILDEARVIYEGEAERIHFPGKEGEFEAAEDHMPLLSLLGKGTIHIKTAEPMRLPAARLPARQGKAGNIKRNSAEDPLRDSALCFAPFRDFPIERGVVKIEGNKVLAVVELA